MFLFWFSSLTLLCLSASRSQTTLYTMCFCSGFPPSLCSVCQPLGLKQLCTQCVSVLVFLPHSALSVSLSVSNNSVHNVFLFWFSSLTLLCLSASRSQTTLYTMCFCSGFPPSLCSVCQPLGLKQLCTQCVSVLVFLPHSALSVSLSVSNNSVHNVFLFWFSSLTLLCLSASRSQTTLYTMCFCSGFPPSLCSVCQPLGLKQLCTQCVSVLVFLPHSALSVSLSVSNNSVHNVFLFWFSSLTLLCQPLGLKQLCTQCVSVLVFLPHSALSVSLSVSNNSVHNVFLFWFSFLTLLCQPLGLKQLCTQCVSVLVFLPHSALSVSLSVSNNSVHNVFLFRFTSLTLLCQPLGLKQLCTQCVSVPVFLPHTALSLCLFEATLYNVSAPLSDYVCLLVCLSISVSLSLCLSACLSVDICQSVSMSVCLSVNICQSVAAFWSVSVVPQHFRLL